MIKVPHDINLDALVELFEHPEHRSDDYISSHSDGV
jgi:hypothetical protein